MTYRILPIFFVTPSSFYKIRQLIILYTMFFVYICPFKRKAHFVVTSSDYQQVLLGDAAAARSTKKRDNAARNAPVR